MKIRKVFASLMSRKVGTVAALTVLAIGACFFHVRGAFAGKPPAIPDYAIKIEFRNAVTDNILSVGSPVYTNGETNKAGQVDVNATIDSLTGGVNLVTLFCSKGGRTCTSLGRYHYFDLSEPVLLGAPLPTSQSGWSDTNTIAPAAAFSLGPLAGDGSTLLANGFRDLMNFPGETRLARMKVNFSDASGSTFTIRFTPNFYPESNYLLATYLGGSLVCSSTDTSKCASWTVEAFTGPFNQNPIGCCKTSDLQDIAALPSGDNSIYYGTYHVPVKMTVTVLPTK